MVEEAADVGILLERARGGESAAVAALFEHLYGDLRRIAHARLREGERDALLDTTALVHESYARFAKLVRLDLADRSRAVRSQRRRARRRRDRRCAAGSD